MFCFASSILLLMVLIFMEDWREREREAYLSEKSMPAFLYNKLLLRNATKYVLLLAPEVESLKKGHFYILFFTLMYWHIGRSIHDWAKVTELHSWCIDCNEVASYNIINSDRTKRNTQFSLELSSLKENSVVSRRNKAIIQKYS